MVEPLAIFKDGDGNLVKVYEQTDVNEWEKAGFKKVGKKEKAEPKLEAKPEPRHQGGLMDTVQRAVRGKPKDDDEL